MGHTTTLRPPTPVQCPPSAHTHLLDVAPQLGQLQVQPRLHLTQPAEDLEGGRVSGGGGGGLAGLGLGSW